MNFLDNWTKGIKDTLTGDIQELLKGDADQVAISPQEIATNKDAIGQKAIITDPFFDQVHQHFVFRNKLSRISNKTLKDLSVRDWLASAIIQARCDTMLRFARPQRRNLDIGYKIHKKDRKADITTEEHEEIANIEDFIYNCGRKAHVPPGEEMLFGEFLKLTTRDALTYGHVAVEKIFTRAGALHRFRPVPSEAMYLINQKTSRDIIAKEIETARVTYKQKHAGTKSANDPELEHQFNEPDIDYFKYVQMSYDNRILAAFGDADMIWSLFNPQNFSDSMGYCYSPLELSIINLTNHLNIDNYNANFFTHGYAARGLLHLKGTVTPAQLVSFRKQFYNTISGAQNAWRTPIVAGLDDVQWVPMSGSAKEMEYLNYNNHIMRALCTQFQIDPVELGLDYLVTGTGRASSASANNEAKINYSRERGLIPILMMFEDMINQKIIPILDSRLADKYEFKFTGIDEDSPQTQVAQLQAEMTVHSSMNDLLRAAGKTTMKQEVADLPLNQTFWGLIEKNYTKAEIRSTFFGDKSAMGKRELAYFPADPMFLQYQQLLISLDRAKKQDAQQAEAMEAQQQQQQHEQQMAEGEHSRDQEQHDAAMGQNDARQAQAVVQQRSLKDIGKDVGLGSAAAHVGGQSVANPINTLGDV